MAIVAVPAVAADHRPLGEPADGVVRVAESGPGKPGVVRVDGPVADRGRVLRLVPRRCGLRHARGQPEREQTGHQEAQASHVHSWSSHRENR